MRLSVLRFCPRLKYFAEKQKELEKAKDFVPAVMGIIFISTFGVIYMKYEGSSKQKKV